VKVTDTPTATASQSRSHFYNDGGLIGMLITAAVKQIANDTTDASYPIASNGRSLHGFFGNSCGSEVQVLSILTLICI